MEEWIKLWNGCVSFGDLKKSVVCLVRYDYLMLFTRLFVVAEIIFRAEEPFFFSLFKISVDLSHHSQFVCI